MIRIAIVIGSTRPGRVGEAVAHWVRDVAASREDAEFEVLDIAEFGLPVFDEPTLPALGRYSHDHTRAWSEAVARFDGYVFVTAEYNHSIRGALKNAIDFLKSEWADKAAGFVGYGSVGGARAIEHLRLVMAEMRVATVRDAVYLSLGDDFVDMTDFMPRPQQFEAVEDVLYQVIRWSSALAPLRGRVDPAL